MRDATVVRGGQRILDRVAISIEAGEHTVVLGPNGSGKSTLIKLLTGEVYPIASADDHPAVRVFGRDRWNLTELRSRLGIVSADVHLRFVGGSSLGRATGLEAVLAAFFASEVVFLHHRVTDDLRRRAAAALERVGAGHLGSRRMHEMSSGEARRVLLARALVHDPELLVLDEPTTGLDTVAREAFLARLRTLAADGHTLVLVTHHLEEIIPEIRRVVLLANGRVLASGPPDAVLTSELLGRSYGAEVTLTRDGSGYSLRLRKGHG